MMRVLAVLEGQKGVHDVEPDSAPKTILVAYDPAAVTAVELVSIVDHADIRLRAHHRIAFWLSGVSIKPGHKRTARVLSDRPM